MPRSIKSIRKRTRKATHLRIPPNPPGPPFISTRSMLERIDIRSQGRALALAGRLRLGVGWPWRLEP